MLGGPIGAVLGAVLANRIGGGGGALGQLEQKQSVFFTATFAMFGQLSKADGQVSASEIALVERVMRENLRLDAKARALAIQIFNEAKDGSAGFMDYAEQFQGAFAGQPQMLAMLMELLTMLAFADGELHPEEDRLLSEAARLFGCESVYASLKAKVKGMEAIPLETHYETLGCTPGMTLAEVKRAYRRLAMKHHPDRVQADGLPPELLEAAEARFKDIQNAFDAVEKALKPS
jgi:DnaJ like chaperone protein